MLNCIAMPCVNLDNKVHAGSIGGVRGKSLVKMGNVDGLGKSLAWVLAPGFEGQDRVLELHGGKQNRNGSVAVRGWGGAGSVQERLIGVAVAGAELMPSGRRDMMAFGSCQSNWQRW